MKTYIHIQTCRKQNVQIEPVTEASILVSDNITGWNYDYSNDFINVFLLNGNFSYYRLYMTEQEFYLLVKEGQSKTANRNGSLFIYTRIVFL